MIIVGCDYHPSFQQIAFVDTETGELKEQRLLHREAAEEFYRGLAAAGQRVRTKLGNGGAGSCSGSFVPTQLSAASTDFASCICVIPARRVFQLPFVERCNALGNAL